MSQKKRGKSGLGPLADQLKKLDLDLKPGRSSEASRAPGPKASKPSAQKAPPEAQTPSEPEQTPLSDEELFEMAVEKLDPSRIFQGKYQGEASAELPPDPHATSAASRSERAPKNESPDPQAEEDARQHVFEARDAALFMRAVAGAKALERDERVRPQHGKNRELRRADDPDEEPEPDNGLITPSLPRDDEGLSHIPPLTRSQRALITRYQQVAIGQRTGQINLRGDTLEDALRQLELYLHQWWKSDDPRYVRVIHGRGLHSEDGPVLKPAVLEWLEGPGLRYVRGYAPERTPEGDYGSLIVELIDAPEARKKRSSRGGHRSKKRR
ncbi:hypothetical protein EA187_19980 [Lujinxingia sediminis]|uniref:Smr domain-containing protein n=1 Tax=Lujinxingia sediminis TaxID=2480984 RepID=A0ABY0CMM9_9DELT|nr:Smr/MutS family protein [Lujinxingia sediminis]RVU40674.1 hypothetical protein EA187_19980 [Lujinxingia sediminis]